jgi:DNA-binding GntR family transcriptional regulator
LPKTNAMRRSTQTPTSRRRPEKGHGSALAYEWLKRRIVSLELLPGSTIDEAALVKLLGVSRTPVREAIVRLGAEGLIELLPNRGARVASMDLSQLQEHLEAFELMQRAATVFATLNRPETAIGELSLHCSAFERAAEARDVQSMIDTNWEFHHAIGIASGNRYVARMYTGLLTEGLRIARLAMAYECYGSNESYERHLGAIIREHRELITVITDGDTARASLLADSHSNLARVRINAYLSRDSSRHVGVHPRLDPLREETA